MALMPLLASMKKQDGSGMTDNKNKEVEHKFLVDPEFAQTLVGGNFEKMEQFYLTDGFNPTIRVRGVDNLRGFITIKGLADGPECPEFEYPIPYADVKQMDRELEHTTTVEKFRYTVALGYCDKLWHVDIFHGDNEGLYTGEVELKFKGEEFVKPPWVLEEITNDHRYKNINLSLNPYCNWKD